MNQKTGAGTCGKKFSWTQPPARHYIEERFPSRDASMSAEWPFQELIRRVRAGDESAAADLVRRYEPAVRRAVRFRLLQGRFGGVFDSMDVCQSVFASFFFRAAFGEYDLEQPDQLVKVLVAMARNKLASRMRQEHAECRDRRRIDVHQDPDGVADKKNPSPSHLAVQRELAREVSNRLSAQERLLVDLRSAGRDWASIAAEVGGTPVALRQQLSRALNRVSAELGLDGGDHAE
jgi:RNA polymerase sigma-70 factor (ECF subfamily)